MFCQLPFLVLSIAAVFPGELMLDEVPFRHLFRVSLCSVENKEESFFSIPSWNVRGREERRPCFKCHLAHGKSGKWTMVPGAMENSELDWNSPVMCLDKDWSIFSYTFFNLFVHTQRVGEINLISSMVLKWFTASEISIWNYLLCKKRLNWRRENSLFVKKWSLSWYELPVLCYSKVAILNFKVVIMKSIEVLSNDCHSQKKNSELFI